MAEPDAWAPVGGEFVDQYERLYGQVRTYVVHQHLRAHLPPPPAAIVDVGGGGGQQMLPLARDGYDVVIVDPSPAMLDHARACLAAEPAAVRERVDLVEARGEDASDRLGGVRFAGVCCHGVLMYLDDPDPLVIALAQLAAPGGIVSIVTKNARTLAMRPASRNDWDGVLAAFASDDGREVNGLGLDTRGDTPEDLAALLAAHGVDPIEWYGVRLFTEGWARDRPAGDPADKVLAAELEASRRDPYRQLSRLFHIVGRRRQGSSAAASASVTKSR